MNYTEWTSGYGDALSYAPPTSLREAFATPLTKTTIDITGYNTSHYWPSNQTPLAEEESWSLSLALAAGISTDGSTGNYDEGLFFDAFALSLDPPQSLVSTTTDGDLVLAGGNQTLSSWRASVFMLSVLPDAYYADARADDGSCSAMLPAACYDEAYELILSGGDDDLALSSCGDEAHLAKILDLHLADLATALPTSAIFAQSSEPYADASSPPSFRNDTVLYGNYATGVRGYTYPVFVRWEAGSDEASAGTVVYQSELGVACLNVEDEQTVATVDYGDVEEDDGGEEDGDNAGTKVGAGGLWALIAAAAASGLVAI